MPMHVYMVRQCASKSYQKSSVVEEHHVYKVIWIPEVGEELLANCEYDSEHAVVVMKDGEIFGHLTWYNSCHVPGI